MINPILALRIAQGLLALIILGIAAHLVDILPAILDSANFMVFNSVWTFLALAYLVATPVFFPNLHNRWAVLGVEAITMVFWFAGFIALAVDIKRLVCLPGSVCPIPTARAVATFGAFEWLVWAATLGLVVRALIQYGKGDPEDVEGIQPPAGGGAQSSPNSASPSGSPGIEMNGGPQFERKPYQTHHRDGSGSDDGPPLLPQFSELGHGHEGGFDGGLSIEMPEVDGFGGRTY